MFLHFCFSPLCWELVTWKEEVFRKWLKWDVSLRKLSISKMSPWKQWRLSIFMPYENTRQKTCSHSSCHLWHQKYGCADPGGDTFSLTPLLALRTAVAIFFFNLMDCHLLDWSHSFHSQGHQTPLKVTTYFSSAWILFKYALWAWLKILAEYECLRFVCLSTENPAIGYWRSLQDGGSSQTQLFMFVFTICLPPDFVSWLIARPPCETGVGWWLFFRWVRLMKTFS